MSYNNCNIKQITEIFTTFGLIFVKQTLNNGMGFYKTHFYAKNEGGGKILKKSGKSFIFLKILLWDYIDSPIGSRTSFKA